MRKFTVLVTILIVASLMPMAAFAGGPAEKATGTIYPVPQNFTSRDINRYVSFDAHEAQDRRPAKGNLYWEQYKADGVISEQNWVEVKYVKVEGDTAWFAGQCYASLNDLHLDEWLFVRVEDGAEHGAGNDLLWAQWFASETAASNAVSASGTPNLSYTVSAGNLVVHTYD